MQGSKDGTVLVSADGNGKIALYDFETLKLIYNINSNELAIRGFAFSNDGLRFFDVRADHCNVWEPPVLVRRTEVNDESSQGFGDDASNATPPTIDSKTYDTERVITTVTACESFDMILCGREDGSVAVYSALTGALIQELASHVKSIAIKSLCLSQSQKILISLDRSGRIAARRITTSKCQRITETGFITDQKAINVVEQILISPDDTRILVSMPHKDQIWELKTANTLGEITRSNDRSHWRWTQILKSSWPLIYFSDGKVTLYNWDFHEASSLGGSIDLCLAEAGYAPVRAVFSSSNALQLGILLAFSRSRLQPPCLRVWSLQKLHALAEDSHEPNAVADDKSTERLSLPKMHAHASYDHLAKAIKFAIGLYEDSLIFLTHQGWVCSLKVSGVREETYYTRHFFIPFRYHNNGSSLVMDVTSKGNIIVAFRTEVIIFVGGLDFEEKISWKSDTVVPRPSMKSTLGRGRSAPISILKDHSHFQD